MSLVLPPVKKYVQAKMESHFKMLKLVEDNHNPRQGLTCDPLKQRTKFENPEFLTTHTELWKFYIDSEVHKLKFENLDDCDDINVFFTIMSKAGCFKNSEANLA